MMSFILVNANEFGQAFRYRGLDLQVIVGCSTVDIIRHLSGEEISRIPKDGSSGDRLSRLATHIISQRRHVINSCWMIFLMY